MKFQIFTYLLFFSEANPKPAYPVVDGCSHGRFCVLRVNKEGRLSCTVYGIRPLVTLQWVWFGEELYQPVTFHDQEYTIKANTDGTYDVSLTASYLVEERSLQRLTVECKTTETELKLSSNIELLFISGKKACVITCVITSSVVPILKLMIAGTLNSSWRMKY